MLAARSAGGHDSRSQLTIVEFQGVIQTQTYGDRLVDLTDIANAVGQKYGGWVGPAKSVGVVLSQSPSAGSSAPAYSQVTIVVGS